MNVETLKKHLKNLSCLGLVSIVPRFSEGVQLANSYVLNTGGGGVENNPYGGGKNVGGGGVENCPPVNQEVNQEVKHNAPLRSALFDKFWHQYPKKVGKDAAEKAFSKRKPDEELTQEMINAVEQQSASEAWTKEGGKYIPNPATWLNQGRWKDEAGDDDSANMFAGAI